MNKAYSVAQYNIRFENEQTTMLYSLFCSVLNFLSLLQEHEAASVSGAPDITKKNSGKFGNKISVL
jgi:hypothetical protein